MFRDQEPALGNIEHLPPLDPYRRLRIERRTAMPASAGLVANYVVEIGRLPQRAAQVALLPPQLPRTTAKAAGDPRLLAQPLARRRLGAVRTVQTQTTPKFTDLGLKSQYLSPQLDFAHLDCIRDLSGA